MPEVWPPRVSRQEEEMRRVWIWRNYNSPKILVAEQEDQQSPHCLVAIATSICRILLSLESICLGRSRMLQMWSKDAADRASWNLLLRQRWIHSQFQRRSSEWACQIRTRHDNSRSLVEECGLGRIRTSDLRRVRATS
jgi:hypothetical protein